MHFAKSTKSDVSNRKTIQVTGAYAEVLIHLLNVTKKARVAPAYGKVRERCLALEKDRKALVAGCPRVCVSPARALSETAACSVSMFLCTLIGHPQALSPCLSFQPGILGEPLLFQLELSCSVR